MFARAFAVATGGGENVYGKVILNLVWAPNVDTATDAVDAGKCDEASRGVAKGATLANASWSPKAAESITGKATSGLARLPASESSLSLLQGGGGGRRLALAGQRPATRCVRVHELAGRGDHWGPLPALSIGVALRALYLMGSGRPSMARKRLPLLRSGGQVGRRGRRS